MRRLLFSLLLTLTPFAASADWTISPDNSKVAFGSVKKNAVGESHHFSGVSGGVKDGVATIEIDLASVETYIDIRNERMAEFVFSGMGPAKLTAPVDVAALEDLKPGQMMTMDIEGTLTLGPVTADIEASVYAVRLSETRSLIATDEMIWVSTEELGVDAGVDELKRLAELSGITRASPVTFRLVFDKGETAAEATTTTDEPTVVAAAAPAGDVKAGAKVFRKCRACHVVDEEKNKVGPHLVDLIGRQAGSVEGFRYSKAFKALDVAWTPEELTAFLAKPKDYVKGTKMSFAGLKKEDDIQNLLAYLASFD